MLETPEEKIAVESSGAVKPGNDKAEFFGNRGNTYLEKADYDNATVDF
jgi:hypothetical protein